MLISLVFLMALQGCPNEGADHRALGWLICPLQRLCSWKSPTKPKLRVFMVAEAEGAIANVMGAVSVRPPYLVVNLRGKSDWRMLRAGWRYDTQYQGFIGPSAAFKRVPQPLMWY